MVDFKKKSFLKNGYFQSLKNTDQSKLKKDFTNSGARFNEFNPGLETVPKKNLESMIQDFYLSYKCKLCGVSLAAARCRITHKK